MKRREFMTGFASLVAGSALLKPMWWPTVANADGALGGMPNANRILVKIVLRGGNDGLNTVIPYTDPLYSQLRPTIAVPPAQVLDLDGTVGLHPSMSSLMPHWDAGDVAVFRGVGYPDMNLSHFRGTDIMFSGSNRNTVWETGWLGRFLERCNPSFPAVLPPAPLALQQGFSAQLPLQAERGTAGVIVNNPNSFYWLVNRNYTGSASDEIPATAAGDELKYLRQVDTEAFEYATVIRDASRNGTTQGVYPDVGLGDQLGTVATLIEGGLQTPVFLVSIGGFDTHGDQLDEHPYKLQMLSEAISAFMFDMNRIGRGDDVAVLTVSEFGRRPNENGSWGTDHGTAAPWFLVGGGINGGLYGAQPPLDSLDQYNNLLVQMDYRTIYASLMQDWFGAAEASAIEVLGGDFGTQPIVAQTASRSVGIAPAATKLYAPRPNPARGKRNIQFDLKADGAVDLSIFDVRGRRVSHVYGGRLAAGRHDFSWDPQGKVATGMYFLVMRTPTGKFTQKLVIQ